MADTLNLLPCPFCGGKPEYEEDWDANYSNRVQCTQCSAEVSVIRSDVSDWNRRASPAAAVPEGALPPLPKTWQERGSADDWKQPHNVYQTAEISEWRARAAVEADRAQRRQRVQLSPEMKAALDKAAETGALVAETPNGIAFINRGHDYGDSAHLECTACGGSGHIDDQLAIAEADRAQQGEPVYQFSTGKDSWLDCDKTFYDNCLKYNYARRIVYLAATDDAAPAPDTGIPTAGAILYTNSRELADVASEGGGILTVDGAPGKYFDTMIAATSHPSEAKAGEFDSNMQKVHIASDDADNLSVMLWLLRRLPRAYGNPPHVVAPIQRLAKRTGTDVSDSFAERSGAAPAHPGEEGRK